MDNNLEIVQTRDEADSRNGRVMPLYTTKGGEMGRSESISDIDLHIVADFQGAVGGIDETVTRGMFKENGDGLHKTSQSSTIDNNLRGSTSRRGEVRFNDQSTSGVQPVLTNAVFPVTDADMCSEVNISTDLQGAVGGVAEVELRHFLPEERSLHESITHKTEQETPPLTIVCKQRKEYDQPAEKTPFSDNVDMDQIKREIMDITVREIKALRAQMKQDIEELRTFMALLHNISLNTTEPDTDMVDLKSMKTLPQPSVENAIASNYMSSHADGNSVSYQCNLSRDVYAYHTDNESKSNEFAAAEGELETKRDVSAMFVSGDMNFSHSSGITNNDSSVDAALETPPDVQQVSQAIAEVESDAENDTNGDREIDVAQRPPLSVEAVLGSGGQAIVTLEERNGQRVAVKHYYRDEDAGENATVGASSIQEASYLTELQGHPQIIDMLGLERTHRGNKLILKYMPGGSLHDWEMPEDRIVDMLWQINQGVAHMHRRRIIHRDLKGNNVLLSENGEMAVLADFGLAERLPPDRDTYIDERRPGTTKFLSKEVVRRGEYSPASDVYAVGCIGIEMLTGKPPWPGLEPHQASDKISLMEGPLPLPPEITLLLRDFLTQCLQPDPENRPSADRLLKHSVFERQIHVPVTHTRLDGAFGGRDPHDFDETADLLDVTYYE